MTDDEHTTRAMLLGMRYSKKYNLYYPNNWAEKEDYGGIVDPDTLEEITYKGAKIISVNDYSEWMRLYRWP